ncbi:MAG TPA: M48 family metalloprotease [Verrucomicrobiae bacterium]|nr:M48 family metalloprotease [Verrucomicrobiae bacterium]
MKSIRIAALVVLMVCSLAVPSFSQLLGLGKKKDPAPAATSKEADQDQEAFYLDMKEFAEGLYNKQVGTGENRQDSDFKRQVDKQYEALRRQDALRAYEVNMSAHSEVRHVIEDRFRVFSGLYDNLLVQDLLNRIGQSVVPRNSGRLYTFKLKADPIPGAETMSTGTIYVTTGLVALLNTKAELAYVLAHEAAHVYHNDYRTEIMLDLAAEEYAKERSANRENVQKKLAFWTGLAASVVGGVASRSATGAVLGGTAGAVTGTIVGGLVERQVPRGVKDWNRVQEDEADRTAFEWLLNANLDVQQIPKVYAALKAAGDRDDRVTLGFLGRSDRVRQRARKIDEMITLEKGKTEFSTRTWVGSDPDFDILMAEVKRDNGILAFQYDMLEVARDNLEKAVAIKKTDPTALYFYARILKETAKTDEERTTADTYFRLAESNDYRNLNYGATLHRAVALLTPDATGADKEQAVSLLKQYVENYYLRAMLDQQREFYPPHLETIYDYMSRLGEFQYVLDPQRVAEIRAAAQKLASSTNGMDLRRNDVPPPVVPVHSSPSPKAPGSARRP